MVVNGAIRTRNVGTLLKGAVPMVRPLQQVLLQEIAEAIVDTPSVGRDGFVLPSTGQAQLAPCADVGGCAPQVIFAEDGVELLKRDACERVVFVDVEHLRIVDVAHVDRSGEELNGERRVVFDALEGAYSDGVSFFAENGDVGDTVPEPWNGRRSAVHAVFEPDAWLKALEIFLPRCEQDLHPWVVCRAMPGHADHTGDLLLWDVGRERGDGSLLDGLLRLNNGRE